MTPETAAALEGSIEKWRRIVAGEGQDRGGDNCPLCDIFNNVLADKDLNCVGCPVAAASGVGGCLGTPYVRWMNHHGAAHGVKPPWDLRVQPNCPECGRVARAELAFLDGLRVDVEVAGGK